jgi:hypothetical protein
LRLDGWSPTPYRAIVFKQRAAANKAAKAAAIRYGCSVDVVNAESPPRRFSTRHQQSMQTLANRKGIDAFIERCVSDGVLILGESNARRVYTY